MASELETRIALLCGPCDGSPSDAQLRRAWRVLGAELTTGLQRHSRPGLRPWAFWTYACGLDDEPRGTDDDGDGGYVEGVRYLAEHDLLTEREWVALRQRAGDPNADRASVLAWRAAEAVQQSR
jgi:hypothetical protein